MVVELLPEVIVPAALGLVVPFITRYFKNENVQTLLNILLSAAIAATSNLPTGLDWKSYAISFLLAWLTTLRADATNLPARLYSKRVPSGRHEKDSELS